MNMTQLMLAELFKLRKRMMTWMLGLLLVGIVVLLYSILWSISGRSATFGEHNQFSASQLRHALFLPSSVPFSLQLVSSFGTLFAVILAAGAVGSEYAWGTVRLAATASSGRLRLMGARLIVVGGLIALGTLLAVAAGLTYSTVIMALNGGADFSFVTGPSSVTRSPPTSARSSSSRPSSQSPSAPPSWVGRRSRESPPAWELRSWSPLSVA